jgi:hypothetical protein
MRGIAFGVLALVACACGSSSGNGGAPAPQGCANDEIAQADGSCQAPGVPASMCAPGFTSDGAGGCAPVLPSTPCAEGLLAVPGDTICAPVGPTEPPACGAGQLAVPGDASCHGVADCGSSPWAGIPVDASTQYVDASYPNADSDGSQAKPWRTIGAAVGAASADAVVAIAAGTYAESVSPGGKTVKLWGRCPTMVTIAGPPGSSAAVSPGPGTEIHTVAITGPAEGVFVGAGSSAVVLDRVWLHDLGAPGVEAHGPLSMTGSLVENATSEGIVGSGGPWTVEASLVRGIRPRASDGAYGVGLSLNQGAKSSFHDLVVEQVHFAALAIQSADAAVDGFVARDVSSEVASRNYGFGLLFVGAPPGSTVTASHVLVERVRVSGVVAAGHVTLSLDDALVRDVDVTEASGGFGFGISTQLQPGSADMPAVTIHRSLVERSHGVGVEAASATLTFDHGSVRDVLADSTGNVGFGINVEPDGATGAKSAATITASILERNVGSGVSVLSSTATVSGSVVRGTAAPADANLVGTGIQATDQGGPAASIQVLACVVASNVGGGIMVSGSQADIEHTVVRDTAPLPSGTGGIGVGAQLSPAGNASSLTLNASVVTGSATAGVTVIEGTATITASRITGTQGLPDGSFGDGVAVEQLAQLQVAQSFVDGNARSGVSAFGADVTLTSTLLGCNAIELDGENGFGEASGQTATYTVDSSNACACGAAGVSQCQVLSSSLQPPAPVQQASTK